VNYKIFLTVALLALLQLAGMGQAIFSEGFENGLDVSVWTKTVRDNTTITTSNDRGYNSSISLKFLNPGPNASGLTHLLTRPSYGSWIYYWYDGYAPSATNFYSGGFSYLGSSLNLSVRQVDKGWGYRDKYLVSGDNKVGQRSIGWHKIELKHALDKNEILIDNISVYQVSPGTQTDHIYLWASSVYTNGSGQTYFDEVSFIPSEAIIYVKADATGANNGSSWTNAYTDLQSALSLSVSGNEIWVAKGTYKPSSGTDRAISFQMKDGVNVYGGFSGNETAIEQRNWTTNETILSGNIGAQNVDTDNSYHVMIGASNTIIDGLIVEKGYADGAEELSKGAGLYGIGINLSVKNCLFRNNYCVNDGAGIEASPSSSMSIESCRFSSNSAGGGAGVHVQLSTAIIKSCIFYQNCAGNGGGFCSYRATSPITIINSLFISNSGGSSGGGIYTDSGTANATNCIFYGNTKVNFGGAVCHVRTGSTVLKNCIVWGNTSPQIQTVFSGTATASYSNIQGGFTGTGNINSDPLFADTATNDFHLKSQEGRWNGTSWVLDTQTSPCIDAGDPTSAYANEPSPNGSRINMGAYGNTVYASKSYVSKTVTFVAGTSGTLTGTAIQTVAQGGNCSAVTAVPNTGYHFVNWTGDYTGIDNPLTLTNVTANKSVTANFAINTYTVTFDLVGKGTRSGGGDLSQTVNHGSGATVPTVSSNTGWIFTGWDKAFNNITGNTTVTAQYAVATYTVTFVEGTNGAITGAKVQTVDHGASASSVTAVPNSGYHFVNWTGALTSTSNPLTVSNVTTNMTITTNFSENDILSNLVLYYPLNGNVNDQSGYGNNGTITGATLTNDRFGNTNRAYYFDNGTTDELIFGNYTRPSNNFSFGAWVKVDKTITIKPERTSGTYYDGQNYVFDPPQEGTNGGAGLSVGTNGIQVFEHGTLHLCCLASYSGTVGTGWNHVFVVYKNKQPTIYLNGVAVRTGLTSAKSNVLAPKIVSKGGYGPYNGSIDEIWVYSSALTVEEISEFYQSESQGLVAYYPFNGNANDESFNGNNGTVNGATLTTDRFGNVNSAYSFDGTNDFISVPHASILNLSMFTIGVWVFDTSSDTTVHEIILKGQYPYNYGIGSGSGGNFGGIFNSGGVYQDVGTTDIFARNKWHYIIFTHDGNTGKIYVDGIQTDSLAAGNIQTNTQPIIFGSYNGSNYFFKGVIDDIRIYNRAFTGEEITQLYQSESQDLVAYYPFNGNANDESGNGNDGTVNGATLTADRFGNANSAYSFNADNFIKANNAGVFAPANPRTYSFWFKMDQYMGNTSPKWYLPNRQYSNFFTGIGVGVKVLAPGYFVFDGNYRNTHYSTTNFTLGNWHHAVFTYNGNLATTFLYLDGVKYNPEFVAGYGSPSNILDGFPINCLELGPTYLGTQDDIRIYNHAFSDTEVANLYANEKPYTVTFDLAGKGSRSGGGELTQIVSYGTGATAPIITPSTGWSFSGWDKTFNNITADTTVTAQYSATSNYTVTFIEGANGTITGTKVQSVSYGSSCTQVTAVPANGYHFANWTGSLTSTANPLTLTNVISNTTITANFVPNQVSTNAIRSVTGTTVSILITPPAGTSAWGIEEIIPAGLTPTAITGSNGNWNATSRKITWYSSGSASSTLGYSVSGNQGSYTVSGSASFNGNNEVIGGSTTISILACHPADTNNDWTIVMSEAISYLAGWQNGLNEMSYAIRAAYLWQNGENYFRQDAVSEPMCWLPVVSAMSNIQLASNSSPALSVSVAASGAVRSISGNSISISINPTAGTSAWGCEEVIPAGLTPTNITSPNGNWNATTRKITWYNTGTAATILSYNVSGNNGSYNVSGVVSFDGLNQATTGDSQIVLGTHTVTFNLAGKGTKTGGGALVQNVNHGTAATAPTVTANVGWTFIGWDKVFETIISDLTVNAQYSEVAYTLTYDAEGGAVSPISKIVVYNTAYGTLAIPARNGYAFAGWWTGDNASGTRVTEATIVSRTSNHTVYAKWTGNTYTVNYDAEGGTVSPLSKPVTFGSVYGSLPTPIRNGYVFIGWRSGDNGTGGKVNSATIVSTPGNHALYAKWTDSLVGVELKMPLPSVFDGYKATVKGLPTGLKYDSSSGMIIGAPAKSGSYIVEITASGLPRQTINLVVKALPLWAQGAFDGVAYLQDSGVHNPGMASMNITALGKITGKILCGGKTYSFSSASLSQTEDVGVLSFQTDAKSGTVSIPLIFTISYPEDNPGLKTLAFLGSKVDSYYESEKYSCEIHMYRNVWKDSDMSEIAANYFGYYTAVLPGCSEYGSGYLTLTVDAVGNVKSTGKLGDGTVLSLNGRLIYDEDCRAYTVIYASPASYQGGCIFGLAEFVKLADHSYLTLNPMDDIPFIWENRNAHATSVNGGIFKQELELTGGWYKKVGNLHDYYQYMNLTLDSDPGAVDPVLTVGAYPYDSAWWNFTDILLKPITNSSGFMTGISAPSAGLPSKISGNKWDYGDKDDNTVGLKIGFNRATGIFKGSFKSWFDYGTTHTYKSISYEGVLTPERNDKEDGVEGRGFFLWSDPSPGYPFKWSYDLLILGNP
jgi:uncharacterized repeat protein (TIGR02543 family)